MKLISRFSNWINSKETSLSNWSSIITIISFPLIIIGLVVGYFQLKDIFILPNVELEFVHPQSISYRLVNNSPKIAEDILVSFGVFDLDSNSTGPVPIPSVEYNYVNRESAKGPFTFFYKFAQKNHRYFGIVYVGCRGCERLNTYWIYARHGSADECFYAERNDRDTYEINVPNIVNDTENYLEKIVPQNRRIEIKK